LFFQEIKEAPKKIHKPVIYLRYVESLSWLSSEYIRRSKKEMGEVKDSERLYPENIIKYKK
jgi:hypothetical protein